MQHAAGRLVMRIVPILLAALMLAACATDPVIVRNPDDLVPVQPTADIHSLLYSQRPAEAAESPESGGGGRNGLSSPTPETAR